MLSIIALLFMAASAATQYTVIKAEPFTIKLPANPSAGYTVTYLEQKGVDAGMHIHSLFVFT
jgi:predicted secreted protein